MWTWKIEKWWNNTIFIFSPSGGGSTVVPYDDDKKDGDRYFVVGCFGSAGYSAFSAKGKAASSISFANCQ